LFSKRRLLSSGLQDDSSRPRAPACGTLPRRSA